MKNDFRIALNELNVEISKFGAKMEKLFPSEVSKVDPHQVLTLPIEELGEKTKASKKTMKELTSKRNEILQMSKKIQDDEKILDVLVKGCLARSAQYKFYIAIEMVAKSSNPSYLCI